MSAELLPGVYDIPSVLRYVHQHGDWPDGGVINLYTTLRRLEQRGFVFAVMDPEGFIPTDDPIADSEEHPYGK